MRADDDDGEDEDVTAERELGLLDSYQQLWRVIRLPSVRVFAALLVTFRLAVLPAEAVAPLKLLEKGVSKEALAGLVSTRRPAARRPVCNAVGHSSALVRRDVEAVIFHF
jgi:hypothetical protein